MAFLNEQLLYENQELRDEIERLRADRDLQCELKHNAWDRADKLQAVVDAAELVRDYPEIREYIGTLLYYKLADALSALEDQT